MFMKKTLLLAILLSFFTISVFAKKRTQDEAQNIALSFLKNTPSLRSTSSESLSLVYACKDDVAVRSSDEKVYYYVFNVGGNGGFVIVSGDDKAKEVLGYSHSGSFDINTIPDNFKNWLTFYKSEMNLLDETTVSTENITTSEYTTRLSFASTLSPLLGNIKWNQSEPYNNSCPYLPSSSTKTVTGCTATAMAQIMKYHSWPLQGTGTKTYTTTTHGFTLSADFGNTQYVWSNMLDSYGGSSTQEQKDEVAKLMYHCGVSVSMNYSSSSGAPSKNVAIALPEYFGYEASTDILYRDYYSSVEWVEIIKTELNANRPVFYAGYSYSPSSGHAFVCDGYDNNGLFHFNWGWGGTSDGYFELSALNPTSLGIGGGAGGYNTNQEIVVGIQKPNASAVATPTRMAYRSFEFTESTINVSQNFTVSVGSIANVGMKTFSGDFGIALFDENDVFIQKLQYSNNVNAGGLPSGYAYTNAINFTGKLPTGINNGKYRVRMVYINNGESEINIMKGKAGCLQYMSITVSGTSAVISKLPEQSPNLSLVSLGAIGSVYANKTGRFTAEIGNSGDDYNSNLIIKLESTQSAESLIVTNDPVVIAQGETKTLSFSGTVALSPGQYTLSVLYDPDNLRTSFGEANAQLLGSTTITVQSEPVGDPAFTLTEVISFEDPTAVYKDNVVLTAKVKSTGGYFDGRIIAFVYNIGGGTSIASFGSQYVTIEPGENKELTFSGTLDVDPGNYYARVYYLYNNSWNLFNSTNNRLNFTLLENLSVGIDNAEIKGGLNLYPNPVTEEVYFDSEKVVKVVKVFDVFGKLVLMKNVNSNGKISVSVDNLISGTYILYSETEDGSVVNKFVKK